MDKSSRVHARIGWGGGGGGGGEGGGGCRVEAQRPENSLDNVFLVLNYFKVFRGDPIFSRMVGGRNFFQGRVHMLSIETHVSVIFQGGVRTPYPPSGSAHGVA